MACVGNFLFSRHQAGLLPPMSSGMIRQALRSRLVRGAPKVKAPPRPPKRPSAYILFTTQERENLKDEPYFKALSPPEKMKELGKKWKAASDSDKAKFQEQADAAIMPTAAAAPELPELPAFVPVKSDKEMDTLVARLEEAGLQGFFIDVLKADDGQEITLPKIGKVTVQKAAEKKPTKNPPLTITFKANPALRSKVE